MLGFRRARRRHGGVFCILSAACAFLSHPARWNKASTPLHEHLAKVGRQARSIAERMRPEAADDAFVAGLLHDIGKLSPWYQKMFVGENEHMLRTKYGHRQHALFSAWAARHLLFGRPCAHHVIHAIAGHHGGLKTRLHTPNDQKSAAAQEEMFANLEKFRDYVHTSTAPESESWRSMKWENCMKSFVGSLNFSGPIKAGSEGSIGAYLRSKCVYSSLLQADRGSFHDITRMPLSMKIQATHAGEPSTRVGRLRKSFQDDAFETYLQCSGERVVVIEAPTGIGKTDLIFRILGYHSERGNYDRAFYFSPLLALTDGFVTALMGGGSTLRPAVPKESDRNLVLEYNHMTAEPIRHIEDDSLHEKIGRREQSNEEIYNTSSFNYPFVVSTTARLLLTIYGNLASNSIKFASLSNSVIIIDEVQTVPKFLLKNLLEALSWIAESSGSKIILVSATIPSELSNMGIRKIRCDMLVAKKFAELTLKTLSVAPSLDMRAVMDAAPVPTAVIFNTRRRAATEFCRNADALSERHGRVIYLTSGIRKSDRLEHIRRIATESRPGSTLVISTQVLEAGVDASFGRMFREMAPLDRIVQAMGRLNRHGGNVAEITVFGRDPLRPYRHIEICETQKVLDELDAGESVTSVAVYSKLHEYYEAVTSIDYESVEKSRELESRMSEHDYDEVWNIVRGGAFADYNVNVFLPYPNETKGISPKVQFESMFEALHGLVGESKARRRREIVRCAARYSASLPIHFIKRVECLLDPALLDCGICMPRDNKSLIKIYDQGIGLDKWVCSEELPC